MICSKDNCTGCFACYNICPKNAIEMIEDEYGNIYPKINKDKCSNCNLCKKICPSINMIDGTKSSEVYAAYSKDKNLRKKSTSGGAATVFYQKVLDEAGIVYGACNIFDNSKFKFIRIEKKEELYKVKGSKYVHCYIGDSYKYVKKDLESGKKVLFIATPCQIAGLRNYLINKYENLFLIDIICHGVPSQKVLFDDINSNKICREDINYISFRDDNGYYLRIFKGSDINNYNKNIDRIKCFY